MPHIRAMGTFYTFCGESIDDVVWDYNEDTSDCDLCSIGYLEGEIEYIKNLNRTEEDKIISWVGATLIGGSTLIVILFVCLVVFG